jgi:hypothetical protein
MVGMLKIASASSDVKVGGSRYFTTSASTVGIENGSYSTDMRDRVTQK